jgi:hypothetical protein
MEISIASHKLIPVFLVVAFLAPSSTSRTGPNLTSYDEPGPRSNCYIKVDDPHISEYYKKRGEVRVKVNARSICTLGHRNVKLTIEIWKDGRIGSNFVGRFSTNPLAPTSLGNEVELKSASVLCKNRQPTDYFAYAYGKAEVNGKIRRTPVAVSKHLELRCGT